MRIRNFLATAALSAAAFVSFPDYFANASVLSSATVAVYAAASPADAGLTAPSIGTVLPTRMALSPGATLVAVQNIYGSYPDGYIGGGGDVCASSFGCVASNGYSSPSGLTPIYGVVNSLVSPGSASISSYSSTISLAMGGVFTNGIPSGSAPAPISLTGDSFSTLSPVLDQMFLMAAGTTQPGGVMQGFVVPAGATDLYLGYLDSYYPDNSGYFTTTIVQYSGTYVSNNVAEASSVPEPGSLAILLGSFGLLVFVRLCARLIVNLPTKSGNALFLS